MEGGTAAAVESKFLLTGIRFVLKKTFSVQELQQVLQACNQFSDVDKELPAQRCLVFAIFQSSFPEPAVFKTVCSSILVLVYHTLSDYKREQSVGLRAMRKPSELTHSKKEKDRRCNAYRPQPYPSLAKDLLHLQFSLATSVVNADKGGWVGAGDFRSRRCTSPLRRPGCLCDIRGSFNR